MMSLLFVLMLQSVAAASTPELAAVESLLWQQEFSDTCLSRMLEDEHRVSLVQATTCVVAHACQQAYGDTEPEKARACIEQRLPELASIVDASAKLQQVSQKSDAWWQLAWRSCGAVPERVALCAAAYERDLRASHEGGFWSELSAGEEVQRRCHIGAVAPDFDKLHTVPDEALENVGRSD